MGVGAGAGPLTETGTEPPSTPTENITNEVLPDPYPEGTDKPKEGRKGLCALR